MYLSLLGNLSLWSVIPNASSLGKSGRVEAGRCIARTSLYNYVSLLSRLYIFIVAENVLLSKICADIAEASGVELFYKTDFDPEIKRAEQGELSRLAFLEKLCKDYGLIVKFADNQIIIVEESALESAESVETFTPDKIKKISFKSTLTEIYKACELNYNHGEHQELYQARVEDATKADGKTLKINRRVNSQTEAEHLAANELREKNKDENKMSLTVRGNFNLSAGSVISIEDFGAFSGRYLLEKVTHKVGSAGYETSATAHLCLDLKG